MDSEKEKGSCGLSSFLWRSGKGQRSETCYTCVIFVLRISHGKGAENAVFCLGIDTSSLAQKLPSLKKHTGNLFLNEAHTVLLQLAISTWPYKHSSILPGSTCPTLTNNNKEMCGPSWGAARRVDPLIQEETPSITTTTTKTVSFAIHLDTLSCPTTTIVELLNRILKRNTVVKEDCLVAVPITRETRQVVDCHWINYTQGNNSLPIIQRPRALTRVMYSCQVLHLVRQ